MYNLKLLIIILLTLMIPLQSFGFSQSDFNAIMTNIQTKEYTQVEKFLKENKTILYENPEYYVILLNYVISKGDKSQLVIAQGTPTGDDIAIKNNESDEIGFIGSRGGYDETLIVNGITTTQEALDSFNYRLDIHFGIVSLAEEIKRWDIVETQIIKMLETSKEINNKWTWGSINSMDGDPKEFMIQNILSRTSTLFRTNNTAADSALENISRAMIRYYPEIIYGYANLGSLYMATKKYDKAAEYYKQAIEIDPNDEIILENIKKLEELRNQ